MEGGMTEASGQPANGAAQEPAVSPDQVLATIQGALSIDNSVRLSAEGLLRAWEADAVPGFLSSLMQIVQQAGTIEEHIRLLACVVAKNAVGSSWRKTLGTREWSRVPEAEKEAVRQAAAMQLLLDPSERVATQLSLLITNIARFDFPGRAPDLLQGLAAAAAWDPGAHTPPPPGKLRALKALGRVLEGLTNKRFVIEPPRPSASGGPLGGPGMMDLRQLSAQIGHERDLFRQKLQEAFDPIAQLFHWHTQAFLGAGNLWEHHGPAARAAATCLAELAGLTQRTESLPPGCDAVLATAHAAISAVSRGPPPGVPNAPLWADQGGRLVERATRMLIAYLDTQPLPFAQYIPSFLPLYVECALLVPDAATVRAMRAKRRVLMVRFIAKCMLCPFYRQEWADAPLPTSLHPTQLQQFMLNKSRAAIARASMETQLQGERAQALTEAVIAKYIALAPEELTEWQEDPEGYARSMDVESGPDADTPRPIGVGLLLCMLERGGEPVAMALVSLAQRLQALGSSAGLEGLLMREASYRCIGEGYTHVAPHVSFSAWYSNELAPLLASQTGSKLSLTDSVLLARALWLVGVCGMELRQQGEWESALRLVARHLASEDLVVALTAMSACLALCAHILDDQAVLESADASERRRKGAGASGIPNLVQAMHLSDETPPEAQQGDEEDEEQKASLMLVRHRVAGRVGTLKTLVGPALAAAFNLLGRLSEVESMVRVLQLVSVLVEVLGEHIKEHLPTIAAALPQIWQAASDHASRNSGALGSFAASALSGRGDTGAGAGAGSEGASANGGAKPGALAVKFKGKGGGSSEGAGAPVRLHSALLAVLTHLVGKVKGLAIKDQQVAGVVFPLLHFATSMGSPESECLVEEAFRLWSVTLSAVTEVPPQLLSLLPHLAAILKRGRDNVAALPILESYILLGAAPSVIPLMDLVQEAMVSTIRSAEEAALASVTPNPFQEGGGSGRSSAHGGPGGSTGAPGQPQATVRIFPAEVAAEAMAAAALADVMLQLSPQEVPRLLAPTFRAMAHVVANPALPAQGVNVKVVNMLEGFLEVLGRVFLVSPSSFEGLMSELAAQQQQEQQQQQAQQPGQQPPGPTPHPAAVFLDKWLTVSSARFIEEMMGVRTMAMLGRYRRRIATAALSALVATRLPALMQLLLDSPATLTRVASLVVMAVMDDAEFRSDQSDLDALDFKADLCEDSVLARRLALTRADLVRSMSILDAARGLLATLAAALAPPGSPAGAPAGPGGAQMPPPAGVEALTLLISSHGSPRLADRVRMLLSGQLLGSGGKGKGALDDDDDDEDELVASLTGGARGGPHNITTNDLSD